MASRYPRSPDPVGVRGREPAVRKIAGAPDDLEPGSGQQAGQTLTKQHVVVGHHDTSADLGHGEDYGCGRALCPASASEPWCAAIASARPTRRHTSWAVGERPTGWREQPGSGWQQLGSCASGDARGAACLTRCSRDAGFSGGAVLSERDRKILAEIERELSVTDPGLVHRFRSVMVGGFVRHATPLLVRARPIGRTAVGKSLPRPGCTCWRCSGRCCWSS